MKLEPKPRILGLMRRDGDGCVWCTEAVDPLKATVDHFVPRVRGGPDHIDNLLLACRRCNPARATTPAAAYLEQLLEQGGQPQSDLVTRALERAWTSRSFSVGAHAVLERCYVAGATESDDLPSLIDTDGWVLEASPLEIGEHYLAARERAVRDLARAHERVASVRGQGLSRRDFALQVACHLEQHQASAAFYLLDGKEDMAFDRLLFRRLRRAFGYELERVFARVPAVSGSQR